MNEGFITMHRKLTQWEWYTDTPTKCLFLHLLLVANFKNEKWRGIDIKRGQRLTSLGHLANETGLTLKQVRLSLEKLIKTGEVGKQTTNQNTMITLIKYNEYQAEGTPKDKGGAKEGQRRGKGGATNNKDNNVKKDNKDNNSDVVDFETENPKEKPLELTEEFKTLVGWLKNFEDISSPNGYARTIFKTYSRDVVEKALHGLNSNGSPSRNKFNELLEYYKKLE